MLYNKIFMVLTAPATIFFVSTILSMSIFTNVSALAQLEERTNQTSQDAGQSANQTGEAIKQNVSCCTYQHRLQFHLHT